uniref:CD97 antigen-like n=1 Tax=Callorhinchus milii TaxID=7868 RepID=A0A4W3H2V5_CALMI
CVSQLFTGYNLQSFTVAVYIHTHINTHTRTYTFATFRPQIYSQFTLQNKIRWVEGSSDCDTISGGSGGELAVVKSPVLLTLTVQCVVFADSASVALISYKNLDSIINGSFHNNQTDPADVVSDIVTLAISNNQSNELLEPVTLTFQLQCVSWDLKEGIWSTNGCVVLRANKTHIECSSRRVASFAVLMAFHDLKDHVHSLNVITLVGIIVSLICLAIALFTFIFCRSIKGVRTTIHTHLCLSLFLAELLFLVGISRTENQVMCFVIAGTLHYLLLVCFSWMLLEGVQLYVMVVQVFHTKSLRPRYMVIFGYGLPLLIVGISVAISEGYVAENYCWLDFKSGWLWAFVAPVCVIILVRLHVASFCAVIFHDSDVLVFLLLRMFTFTAIAQLCLLGCTWLIGVFHFQDDTIVMTYIFTIINSGQGVFIFILHCLFNKQVLLITPPPQPPHPHLSSQSHFQHQLSLSAPTLWNSIPRSLRLAPSLAASFKASLKTLLFDQAFGHTPTLQPPRSRPPAQV